MMDIGVSTGAAPADAASAAKSGRQSAKGGDADNGGFSDVLNKASSSARQGNDTESAGKAPVGDKAPIVNTTGSSAIGKPIIDVDNASLAAQAAAGAKADATTKLDRGMQKLARDDAKTMREAADGLTSDADTDKMAEELVARASKNAKPAKTDKADKADTKSTADGSHASDVLTLLEQTPAEGINTAAAGLAQLIGQQAQTSASVDAKDKSDLKTKSKADAVADVAGTLAATNGRVSPEADLQGVGATDGSEGQTFRLSRADGRGASMDMHLDIENEGAKEAGGRTNVETVSIVDSRRYIGLAQNTNSAAVTAAIAGDSEWARAMHASSSLSNAAEFTSTGKVVNTLKIQMNPIDLGLVTATLRLQGDALNVDLKVETAAAYRHLKEDHTKMLESLRGQGYAIDGVTISMAPTASSDTSSQSNAQSGSQQGAAQGQGGEARERQNQSGQRSAGGFNDAVDGNVASSSGTSGGAGGGDVYL